ncbi:MAG: MarR family transcriptional regulator [Lentisphaeria bacterium]|nr:MarR family transcriptional regulator [Lentisphaeria bacterium]MBQ7395725.1 MarR family transcriptional regulator [Lentisphaeria bacterium]
MKKLSHLETLRMLFGVTEYLRTHLERSRPEFAPGKSATLSQLKVVSCILHSESGKIRIKDIASNLGITSGGVSQIVDNLVRDGLVCRHVSEEDRRVSWVALSEEGSKRRRYIEEFMNGLTDEVMADIPQEKRDAFTEVLSVLYGKLGENLK